MGLQLYYLLPICLSKAASQVLSLLLLHVCNYCTNGPNIYTRFLKCNNLVHMPFHFPNFHYINPHQRISSFLNHVQDQHTNSLHRLFRRTRFACRGHDERYRSITLYIQIDLDKRALEQYPQYIIYIILLLLGCHYCQWCRNHWIRHLHLEKNRTDKLGREILNISLLLQYFQ